MKLSRYILLSLPFISLACGDGGGGGGGGGGSGGGGGNAWTKSTSNPLLEPGAPPAWDDARVQSPRVLRIGTTYHLWYDGRDTTNTGSIGYATSPDGVAWTKGNSGFPVLPQSVGGYGLGSVLFDGTTYRMWFRDPMGDISLFTSTDGLDWTSNPANPILAKGPAGSWEEGAVSGPAVILDGDTYRMWYAGEDASGTRRIGYATSPNGSTWTKYASNPVLSGTAGAWDASGVEECSVLLDGTTYRMWYGGANGPNLRIGSAESTDGIAWTKSAANPVLANGSAGQWDSGSVWGPGILQDGAAFRMWYGGSSPGAPGQARIGTATNP